MKAPSMSLKTAKEYRRWWLINQSKQEYNFVMPAYIAEAHNALDYYATHPAFDPSTPVVTEKPAERVVRDYRKRQRLGPTVLGPLQLADLRAHPELTIKQMSERIGCSYSHMVDLAKKNNIEHYCRYERHRAA